MEVSPLILKKVKEILLNTCAFSTLISLVFCVFIKATNTLSMPAMLVSQYLVILLFGFFIACANLLFTIKSLPKALVYLIHYLTLLISFYIIFVLISKAKFPTASQLFVAFVLFSLVYLLLFLSIFLVKRMLSKKRVPAQVQKAEGSQYTPLYR